MTTAATDTISHAAIRWLPLGVILTGSGLLTQEQLHHALELQRLRGGGRLGELLVELGYLTAQQIAAAVAEQSELEVLDLDALDIDPEAAALLPEQIARRYQALPVRLDGDGLLLAIADPTNLRAADDLRLALGMNFRCAVVEAEQLERTFSRVYRPRITLAVVDPTETVEENVNEIRDLASSIPTINLVNALLTQAIDQGGSDIHFEPKRDRLLVRARVDGMMIDLAEVPKHMQAGVISRLKVMGELDIAERRVPQDGRVSVHFGGEPLDLRVAVLPLRHGEQIVLRILNRREQRPTLDSLGMDERTQRSFLSGLSQPFGAVVVCGPTGSGKTTTLYGALDAIGGDDRVLMTIEDPIEHELPNANQIEVDERAGLTFARGLRTILRSDPDILLVGEIRDEETASIAMQAAMTGHLVLTTLHAHTAAAAITRLREMGVPGGLISASLNCIVAQRLARRLCVDCCEAHVVTAEEASPEVPAGLTVFRAVGCPRCNSTGYRGRVPLFEVLPVQGEVRSLIEESAERIFAAAVRQGMTTLRSHGLRLVREGVCSFEEIRRVIGDRLA
jgi:type IV pilus assembly protein PilB